MDKMKHEIKIVKNLLLPLIEVDINSLVINWQAITSGFVSYEKDSKLLYAEIYKLELSDPEKVLSKLDELYRLFIDELAEAYTLEGDIDASTALIEQSSFLFSERVTFFKTLKSVITKHERHRITNELPNLSDRIDFSLSDNDINSVIKKKARTDLKDKFGLWDKELLSEKENKNIYSSYVDLKKPTDESLKPDFNIKNKGKVISLSWIKYVVAAVVIISAGYFYFNSDEFQKSKLKIVDLDENTGNVLVISESGLGYTDTTKKDSITITYILDKERKEALEEINNSGELVEASSRNAEWSYTFSNNTLKIYGFTKVPEAVTGTIIKTSQNKYQTV
jgi:hypothetical protein